MLLGQLLGVCSGKPRRVPQWECTSMIFIGLQLTPRQEALMRSSGPLSPAHDGGFLLFVKVGADQPACVLFPSMDLRSKRGARKEAHAEDCHHGSASQVLHRRCLAVTPARRRRFPSSTPRPRRPCTRSLSARPRTSTRRWRRRARAFETFSLTTREERIELLSKIIEVYKRRLKDIGAAISEEMGAPLWLSQSGLRPAPASVT